MPPGERLSDHRQTTAPNISVPSALWRPAQEPEVLIQQAHLQRASRDLARQEASRLKPREPAQGERKVPPPELYPHLASVMGLDVTALEIAADIQRATTRDVDLDRVVRARLAV